MIFVSLSVLAASDQYLPSCLSFNINLAMTTDYPTEGDEKGSLILFSFHPLWLVASHHLHQSLFLSSVCFALYYTRACINTVSIAQEKKPYRAKRLGIYTLGMQLCFYETVFAKESAISGRDRHVCMQVSRLFGLCDHCNILEGARNRCHLEIDLDQVQFSFSFS